MNMYQTMGGDITKNKQKRDVKVKNDQDALSDDYVKVVTEVF